MKAKLKNLNVSYKSTKLCKLWLANKSKRQHIEAKIDNYLNSFNGTKELIVAEWLYQMFTKASDDSSFKVQEYCSKIINPKYVHQNWIFKEFLAKILRDYNTRFREVENFITNLILRGNLLDHPILAADVILKIININEISKEFTENLINKLFVNCCRKDKELFFRHFLTVLWNKNSEDYKQHAENFLNQWLSTVEFSNVNAVARILIHLKCHTNNFDIKFNKYINSLSTANSLISNGVMYSYIYLIYNINKTYALDLIKRLCKIDNANIDEIIWNTFDQLIINNKSNKDIINDLKEVIDGLTISKYLNEKTNVAYILGNFCIKYESNNQLIELKFAQEKVDFLILKSKDIHQRDTGAIILNLFYRDDSERCQLAAKKYLDMIYDKNIGPRILASLVSSSYIPTKNLGHQLYYYICELCIKPKNAEKRLIIINFYQEFLLEYIPLVTESKDGCRNNLKKHLSDLLILSAISANNGKLPLQIENNQYHQLLLTSIDQNIYLRQYHDYYWEEKTIFIAIFLEVLLNNDKPLEHDLKTEYSNYFIAHMNDLINILDNETYFNQVNRIIQNYILTSDDNIHIMQIWKEVNSNLSMNNINTKLKKTLSSATFVDLYFANHDANNQERN